MRQAGGAQESFVALIASIAVKLLRLGYLACCLGALQTIGYCAPHVPTVLRRVALLGTVLCFVFELVLRVPGFPFWFGMVLPAACAALLMLHRALGVEERRG